MSKRRTHQLIEGMTGTVIATILTTAPDGWLLFNGDTMGSDASSATRAGATYENLFLALWASLSNTDAPVSGGRGATAAADWAANKTITLPDLRGRSIIGTGTGTGLTARTHGAKVGAETHTLSEAELAPHNHRVLGGTDGTSASAKGLAATGIYGFAGHSVNTAIQPRDLTTGGSAQFIEDSGSGTAHNNMQPSMALNWIVKV